LRDSIQNAILFLGGAGSVATCRCFSIDAIDHDGSLVTFARARDECAALKEILVPASTWPAYRDFCSADPDEAFHAPVTYLAFKRRHLAQLTEPIHLFCLTDGKSHPSLTRQYRQDLAERWMFKKDVKQRFQVARKFQGRLAELLFAAWLHHEGWRIEALEALGGGTDVVATTPAGESFFFEVKHLGRDEALFDLGVEALGGGGVSFGHLSVYSPVDYLVFRIFEAAKQLSRFPGPKIVVAVLQEYDVSYAIPLKESWIDWKNPAFIRKDGDIEKFLGEKYALLPNLDDELKRCISQVDQIWFYELSHGLTLTRRQIDRVRR
jgi:hypothetical protein